MGLYKVSVNDSLYTQCYLFISVRVDRRGGEGGEGEIGGAGAGSGAEASGEGGDETESGGVGGYMG